MINISLNDNVKACKWGCFDIKKKADFCPYKALMQLNMDAKHLSATTTTTMFYCIVNQCNNRIGWMFPCWALTEQMIGCLGELCVVPQPFLWNSATKFYPGFFKI